MKERKQPIKPTQEMGQSINDWRSKFPVRGLFKLGILIEVILVMLVKRVNWPKALATVDQKYYQKCLDTGEANFVYRPADITRGEIGPQSTDNFSGYKWDWIWLVLIILWLYRRIKKAKQ